MSVADAPLMIEASRDPQARQALGQLAHTLGQLAHTLGQLAHTLGQLARTLGQLAHSSPDLVPAASARFYGAVARDGAFVQASLGQDVADQLVPLGQANGTAAVDLRRVNKPGTSP